MSERIRDLHRRYREAVTASEAATNPSEWYSESFLQALSPSQREALLQESEARQRYGLELCHIREREAGRALLKALEKEVAT